MGKHLDVTMKCSDSKRIWKEQYWGFGSSLWPFTHWETGSLQPTSFLLDRNYTERPVVPLGHFGGWHGSLEMVEKWATPHYIRLLENWENDDRIRGWFFRYFQPSLKWRRFALKSQRRWIKSGTHLAPSSPISIQWSFHRHALRDKPPHRGPDRWVERDFISFIEDIGLSNRWSVVKQHFFLRIILNLWGHFNIFNQ